MRAAVLDVMGTLFDLEPLRPRFEQAGAHAWDVVGAGAVGMERIWISRLERAWPLPVAAPAAADLVEAADLVLSSGGAVP